MKKNACPIFFCSDPSRFFDKESVAWESVLRQGIESPKGFASVPIRKRNHIIDLCGWVHNNRSADSASKYGLIAIKAAIDSLNSKSIEVLTYDFLGATPHYDEQKKQALVAELFGLLQYHLSKMMQGETQTLLMFNNYVQTSLLLSL